MHEQAAPAPKAKKGAKVVKKKTTKGTKAKPIPYKELFSRALSSESEDGDSPRKSPHESEDEAPPPRRQQSAAQPRINPRASSGTTQAETGEGGGVVQMTQEELDAFVAAAIVAHQTATKGPPTARLPAGGPVNIHEAILEGQQFQRQIEASRGRVEATPIQVRPHRETPLCAIHVSRDSPCPTSSQQV
jgi:hypothetical protein